MAKDAQTVATALKKASEGTKQSNLVAKLNASGIYREDGTELTVKETPAVYKEYDKRSNATLKEEAQDYADRLYAMKVGNTNASADKKINDLDTKLQTAELNVKTQGDKLHSSYRNEVRGITERVIKNGTVTSSIFGELLDSAKADYERKLMVLNEEFAIKKGNIEREISIVEEQRKSALIEYDLKKALDFEKRLSELKIQQTETNKEIAEYNAKVKEFEENYEENKRRTLEEWRRAIEEGKVKI